MFQPKAWANREICLAWITDVFVPATSNVFYCKLLFIFILEQVKGEHLLICDSLDGQTTDEFKNKLARVCCFFIYYIYITIA